MTDTHDDSYSRRWRAVMADNYGTPPITLVRGQGVSVWDDVGREYLDLVGGLAVNALGHAHPAVVAAVCHQVSELGHTSNLVIQPRGLELAEALTRLVMRGRSSDEDHAVFFCNSGAEANEAAFKATRLTGRRRVVAARDGFHGRTMGALALTGQPAKADPFRPLPGDVVFVPYGDAAALVAAVDDETAAVILEPIQGEAGVIPAPPGYLATAQRAAGDHGALLVLDEVQTGIGRTGYWFAHQDPTLGTIRPDIITLAKGLGGGLPIGATIFTGRAARLFNPGSHGSTFGGNPISAAAALAVLMTIEGDDLLGNAQRRGRQLARGLGGCPGVRQVRGSGLLLGVVLAAPVAKAVEAIARDECGLLVNAPASDVIRLAPPLVLTQAAAERAVRSLSGAIERAVSQHTAESQGDPGGV